jgi:glycosyltransferase involved in cell wall biosynthesis
MKVLLIIPAYNEGENIERVVNTLVNNFPQYDYVIMNDGSSDGTEEICAANRYNYISLPINLGIGGNVQCGYRYAMRHGYDIAVQFDGDGQHNPEYIRNLIDPILNGRADMVIGSRFIEKKGFQTSYIRRFGITIIKVIIKICCGVKITDTTSGFRATNRELIKFFSNEYAQDYPESEAIVSAALNGYKIIEVPVVMNERVSGVSSINMNRSVYYMFKVSLALIIYRMSIRKRKTI